MPHDRESCPRFARICRALRIDDPLLFGDRKAVVLETLHTASELSPAQVHAMAQAQRTLLAAPGRSTRHFSREWKGALGRLIDEARRHGRLAPLGQAWASSNRMAKLLTADMSVSTQRLTAAALSGEVLWQLLSDLENRQVMLASDEDVLRGGWQGATEGRSLQLAGAR